MQHLFESAASGAEGMGETREPQNWLQLGISYQIQGKLMEAKEAYETAIRYVEAFSGGRWWLAMVVAASRGAVFCSQFNETFSVHSATAPPPPPPPPRFDPGVHHIVSRANLAAVKHELGDLLGAINAYYDILNRYFFLPLYPIPKSIPVCCAVDVTIVSRSLYSLCLIPIHYKHFYTSLLKTLTCLDSQLPRPRADHGPE